MGWRKLVTAGMVISLFTKTKVDADVVGAGHGACADSAGDDPAAPALETSSNEELMVQGDPGTADDGRKEADRNADVDALPAPEVKTDIAAAEEEEDAAPSTSHRAAPDVEQPRRQQNHGLAGVGNDRWLWQFRHLLLHRLSNAGAAVQDCLSWFITSSRDVENVLPRQRRAGAGNLLPVSGRDFEENRPLPTTEQAAFLSLSVLVEPIKRIARLVRDTWTILTAVDEDTPADQLEQQRKRCSKYSDKTFMFTVTIFAAFFAPSSFVNEVFNVLIEVFFMALNYLVDLISATMKPKWGVALIYLSWFLLVLMLYLRLVSFNKYYGYAILPVPIPIVAAFLHHELRPGVQRSTDHNEADLDGIFDLSTGIVNCGAFISAIFRHYMVGPNQSIPFSAVGCLFFLTIVLGLYLMMIATVRNVALTSHAIYLDMLLKVLVVSTVIATLIR